MVSRKMYVSRQDEMKIIPGTNGEWCRSKVTQRKVPREKLNTFQRSVREKSAAEISRMQRTRMKTGIYRNGRNVDENGGVKIFQIYGATVHGRYGLI